MNESDAMRLASRLLDKQRAWSTRKRTILWEAREELEAGGVRVVHTRGQIALERQLLGETLRLTVHSTGVIKLESIDSRGPAFMVGPITPVDLIPLLAG
ncbi:MAG: hypothetical protein HYU04_02570 [Candidatus Wildermuthbacteria bacterium]|nr:hypothetical protein [Candidatus Wildermuthbacteria bacterium]